MDAHTKMLADALALVETPECSPEPKFTPGPWFVSGVRFKMNGGEWHSINRYDKAKKRDENIACVGYDPRTGLGWADARLIAAAPDMLAALKAAVALSDKRVSPIGRTPECQRVYDQCVAAVSKAAQS